MQTNHRICFCTAIKNRLHHFRETLLKNMGDNEGYSKLQFVVLDYNSNDGLREWVESDMRTHLRSGRLVYYRTEVPEFFQRAHSRNMLFKLAEGDILCNIDADNFTGLNFAAYVNEQFCRNEAIFLTAGKIGKPARDFLGRICVKKPDFLVSGGYDEEMTGYGFEDLDMVNKLNRLGLKQTKIDKPRYFNAILHGDHERINGERMWGNFYQLYINYISPSKSDVIILFNDGSFHRGRILNCRAEGSEDFRNAYRNRKIAYDYVLEEGDWVQGEWSEDIKEFQFSSAGHAAHYKKAPAGFSSVEGELFYRNDSKTLTDNIILFDSQVTNRNKMNLTKNALFFNPGEPSQWGRGIVFKNMDPTTPVEL